MHIINSFDAVNEYTYSVGSAGDSQLCPEEWFEVWVKLWDNELEDGEQDGGDDGDDGTDPEPPQPTPE